MIIEEYDIENLDCASCSSKIEAQIAIMDGVSKANLDFMTKRLTIQYSDKAEAVLDKLNSIAKGIEPDVKITPRGVQATQVQSYRWYLIFGGLILLLVSVVFALPEPVSMSLGLASYLLIGYSVLRKALREAFSKQLFAEHFLMSIATIGALILGEFTEAVAVMFLYEIGQYLESRAVGKSRNAINSLLALKPDKAHVKTADGISDIKLNEVKLGDRILVYASERIPLDGVVVHGESTLDTSSITGESEPVLVTPGIAVFAGCLNNNGLLEIAVNKEEAYSMISRIKNLIENTGKSPQEKFITRFARIYTPVVVALALLVFVLPVLMGGMPSVWFKRSLIFLIVSCPCALVISIPLSFYLGIGISARQGIIFKGSEFLDTLRKVKTIVFDKTGTLSTGNLRVTKVEALGDIEELKRSMYLAESTSNHPFAKAIKNAMDYPFDSSRVNAFAEYPGKGILIQYDEDRLIVGSAAFLKQHGFVNILDTGMDSSVHVARNDIYLGCACFSDEIRSGFNEVIKRLRQTGLKHFAMLSGDRKAKAEQVATLLELDSYKAELLPEDKLSHLSEIMNTQPGLVAYCGDGLNDAPVLAKADIGIAMGTIGAEASIETADVVLLNDRPEQLLTAFKLSQATARIVWQNIILALGIKVLVMILGVSGISGLWEAIIADVGVTLLVVFNSLRLMKIKSSA
ncbi:MAG TPA: heavy metal translocating P-type ATPase [Candidatus Cloacimonadota bacterium]|nr:heavy metal translocating P-type ATPase [Candidatus Cloacimonadota bacterium]